MIKTNKSDHRLSHPGFYNIYPIPNEISSGCAHTKDMFDEEEDVVIDDHYGRVFTNRIYQQCFPYGLANKLSFYKGGIKGNIIDTLRVPYRKIPIYEIKKLSLLPVLVGDIEKYSPSYEILLRGQTSTYFIERVNNEKYRLYGDESPKEPSFLPSHLRNEFDENFMTCMWHSQATILLNAIGLDYSQTLPAESADEYWKDIQKIIRGPHLTPFSLGIAQHYGLPSIGLDLTKKCEVAAWFATHKMNIDSNGHTKEEPVENYDTATIFVFRCPRNAVFQYNQVAPYNFPKGRPDNQDAWFGHVGWGYAKNQLASYLVCGFRMHKEILNELPKNYEQHLFPPIQEDSVLEFFIKMKNMEKYEGEAKRALQKVYFLQ